MTDSIDFIQNGIHTPIQSIVSDIKYPCTGFCYMAIRERSLLLRKFKESYDYNYYKFIYELISRAAHRKSNNNRIHNDGEFINQDTIKEDFLDIYNQTEYKEYGISVSDPVSIDIFNNDMFMGLISTPINEYVIVNRSNETFLLLKLEQEKFLVVDSHQPKHGTIDIYDAIRYITRNGSATYVQIGLHRV